MGSAFQFTKFNYPTLSFNPNKNQNGTYNIKIKLVDDNKNPKSKVYVLDVIVLTEEEAANISFGFYNKDVIKSGFSPSLVPYILNIDNSGLVKIKFTQEIVYNPLVNYTFDSNVLRIKIIPSS